MTSKTKNIKERVTKSCSCCAKQINVILYSDRTYRGGHYFFKIPIKTGEKVEYWECPKCYWNK